MVFYLNIIQVQIYSEYICKKDQINKTVKQKTKKNMAWLALVSMQINPSDFNNNQIQLSKVKL